MILSPRHGAPRGLPSFPTRRSSDLGPTPRQSRPPSPDWRREQAGARPDGRPSSHTRETRGVNAHSAPRASRWPTDRPLRLLVVLHNLDIGGSQRNSVDLAAGVRDMGHEVVVAGPPGVLEDVIHKRGVRFEAVEELVPDNIAPTARAAYKRIRDLSRRLRPDLIHAYE